MDQFKLFHDRVLTAQGEVESARNAISQALALGTPEGDEQALTLEATLDAAIANEKKWHAFYDKVVASARTKNPLDAFVPLESRNIPDGEKPKGKMTLSEYKAMTPKARLAFAKGGGKIEEGE